jgi:hypothetical protein
MNAVLFLRLTELLDAEQQDSRRKVFIVIDEFQTLADEKPCPGMTDMFLRLRSRGVVVLITYQAQTSLRRVYGDTVTELLGQCSNVIYLQQGDLESAEYAAKDLGHDRGYETLRGISLGGVGSYGGRSPEMPHASWTVQKNQHWKDRPIHSPTELMNGLPPANRANGVEGRAKSPLIGPKPWPFRYPPDLIEGIPGRHPDIPEYVRRSVGTEILSPLTEEERNALLGRSIGKAEAEAAPWDRFNA